MADLERQLAEDRALRDSARKLFRKELAHVRRETKPGAIGERIANRVGEKADAATDAAISFTEDHGKTVTAAVVAAISGTVLWIARRPIADGVAALLGKRDKDAGDTESSGGSDLAEDDQDE